MSADEVAGIAVRGLWFKHTLIEKSPGINASDVAKTMKIKPNYLYRVLGDLEKEGRVKKQGRKYFPNS